MNVTLAQCLSKKQYEDAIQVLKIWDIVSDIYGYLCVYEAFPDLFIKPTPTPDGIHSPYPSMKEVAKAIYERKERQQE